MGKRLAAPPLLVAALLATVFATPAHATFPGANGKIAFAADAGGTSGYEIYTIDPDGTDLTRLTNSAGHDIDPSWSPDGTQLAFASQRTGQASCTQAPELSQLGPTCFDIYKMNADGTGQTQLTTTPTANERGPAWRANGTAIGFESSTSGLRTISPNGGSTSLLWPLLGSRDVTWAPLSSRFAFERNGEIWMVPPGDPSRVIGEGSEPNWSPYQDLILTRIATGLQMTSVDDARFFPALDLANLDALRTSPVWSPNMEWLALAEGSTLALRRPDGAGLVVLANNVEPIGIDWQRLSAPPLPGYVRPQSAPSVQVPLVPAFEECIAPDREHGPPLAFPSCSSPVQGSAQLTVGTPDSNGKPARSVGYAKLKAIPGAASTHPDEADVRLELHITDVRRRSDLGDYTGGLLVPIDMQVTDRDNGCCGGVGGPQAATVQKGGNLLLTAPCAPTSDPDVGSTCSASTTVEAVVPAAIQEGVRTTWELGQVRVLDEDGAPFAVQGLFVP